MMNTKSKLNIILLIIIAFLFSFSNISLASTLNTGHLKYDLGQTLAAYPATSSPLPTYVQAKPGSALNIDDHKLPLAAEANPAEPEPDSFVQELLALVNAARLNNGLAALTLNDQLSQAAQVRAQEADSFFSHTRPDGRSTFTVLAEFDITYHRAGENLAIGQLDAEHVFNSWWESEGHRKNILGDFSQIGIGYIPTENPTYSGYCWAQLFIKPF